MCWQRDFEKIFHIKDANTLCKICDISLCIQHNHSLWIHWAVIFSLMNCKVDGHQAAIMEGKSGTNSCGCKCNRIHENMAVKIKYHLLPQLFTAHNIQWVLDAAPIFAKPLSRMHLFIDNKNVCNPTQTTQALTNNTYICGVYCIRCVISSFASIIIGIIYALFVMAAIGALSWAFILIWIVFGYITYFHIYSFISKAICNCCDPESTAEVDVLYDLNAGSMTTQLVLKAATKQDYSVLATTEQVMDPISINNIVQQNDAVSDKPSLPSSLPAGWRECITNDGRIYYQNSITKKAQWQCPVLEEDKGVEIVVNDEDDDDNKLTLPNGWKKMYTSDGRPYYQNDITKKTQWNLPTD